MVMITVAVPVYNKEEYLHRSIPALLSQTYDDYEILLVDDGSTDRSPEICDRYAAQNPGVRVFYKANGGLSSARNCGIDNARGEYIIFPDPDDRAGPDYLETLMELHNKHRTDLEIAGHYVIKDGRDFLWNKNGRKSVMDTEEALSHLMRWDSFNGYAWNKLFHMEIIRKHRLRFDEELGSIQDLHFCYRYFCLCRSVVYDPRPVYYYDTEAGVSSPSTPLTERKISGLAAYEKIADLAGEEHPAMEAAAYSLLFNICMSYMYAYYYSGMDDPDKLDLLRQNLRKHRAWFFADKKHSLPHKLLGLTAMASPKAYYLCSLIVRKVRGFCGRI